jgi:hypothetical protein
MDDLNDPFAKQQDIGNLQYFASPMEHAAAKEENKRDF